MDVLDLQRKEIVNVKLMDHFYKPMKVQEQQTQFSIIIPTYNSGKTIERALQSIVRQTFKDFEIVVVDGHSGDATLQIVEDFQKQIPSLIYVSQEDEGVYDAMNKGIDLSTGNWLYFLGGDDYLFEADVLEKVYDFIADSEGEIDFVYGNVFNELLNTTYDGRFNLGRIKSKNICHQAIFYKKDLFQKKGRYNLRYSIAADYEFNLKCFLDPQVKIGYIDSVIAFYSKSGLSSQNYDKVFCEDFAEMRGERKGKIKLIKKTLKNWLKLRHTLNYENS